VFIVHARNAWLQGLSPKDNRELPPLRYELVHRLKQEMPQLTIAINGGFKNNEQIAGQLEGANAADGAASATTVDGVMVGREAYHHPALMADWDARFWGEGSAPLVDDGWRLGIEAQMLDYIEQQQAAHGTPWTHVTRHLLGLWNGQPGARRWRQVWSDHRLKTLPVREVAKRAHAARHAMPEPATATAHADA
jgi:tRNA-dihydrouridine synthase A